MEQRFEITKYGRFVNFLFFLISFPFSLGVFTPLISYNEYNDPGIIFHYVVGPIISIMCLYFALSSIYETFRCTPRIVLTDDGISYKTMFRRPYIPWDAILSATGTEFRGRQFIVLKTNEKNIFRRTLQMQTSTLNPSADILLKRINEKIYAPRKAT